MDMGVKIIRCNSGLNYGSVSSGAKPYHVNHCWFYRIGSELPRHPHLTYNLSIQSIRMFTICSSVTYWQLAFCMLHSVLTFRKAWIFIIFEGLRYERPHGTFSVMGRIISWSFFCFSGMSPEILPDLKTEWPSNLIQFRKSRPRPRSGCASRQEAEIRRRKTGPGTWLGRTAER